MPSTGSLRRSLVVVVVVVVVVAVARALAGN
jgi:hypothetical protein